MKKLLLTMMLMPLMALAGEVAVTSVTAKQRSPWNGLVDISVTIQGAEEDVAKAECVFAATNNATKTAIPIEHIKRNGDDAESADGWVRKFIWDAKDDVGAVMINDVALTVDVEVLPYVQLWENGLYWAKCNVGATKPEEYGYYFWWGDTVGYKCNANNNGWISVEDGTEFEFYYGSCPTCGKDNSQLQSMGYIDATGNLVATHDAATAHLGAPWRMPTDAEFSALISNCTTVRTMRNGVAGLLVTGKGAYATKSIFLPAAGHGYDSHFYGLGSQGYYWSSTPNSVDFAWYLYFFLQGDNFYRSVYDRNLGFSVRPVRGFADSGATVGVVTTYFAIDCTKVGLVEVTSLAAQQRSPWNGLVDISVTIQGAVENVSDAECAFVATNIATKMEIPIEHITRNGDDVESDSGWIRRFIWDARADVGAVKIDEIELAVNVKLVDCVQLWENGPYWAKRNVGASRSEECGYYFWWGDTVGYKRNASNDGWMSVEDGSSFLFDCGNCPSCVMGNSQLQSMGYIDATGDLVDAHDAATKYLGTLWRMPTDAEFSALISNCTITLTTRNGVAGLLVIGKGAYATKSIFLPAAGYGYDSRLYGFGSDSRYWSSTPVSDYSYGARAWGLSSSPSVYFYMLSRLECHGGQSVRPVRGFVNTSGGVVSFDSVVTTRFALDTQSGLRLQPAGSALAVNYSPYFSTVQGVTTVRVLTNGAVWVEFAVGGTKDFTFGDTGIYWFTHQVFTNGVAAEEMSAFYAVPETGQIDIPDTWTEIPAGLFMKCDWLKSVTIPSCVKNIGENAFMGCENLKRVNVEALEDWLKIDFSNESENPLFLGADLYVRGERVVCRVEFDMNCGLSAPPAIEYKPGLPCGELPTATRSGYEFDGWYTAASGGTKVAASTVVKGDMTLYAHWTGIVAIANVTAQQRYPWDGLVDIVVTIQGAAEDVVKADCVFVATNSATQAAIPIEHITRNGDDVESDGEWTWKFVWDARADVGAVKIDDVALTVDLKPLGGVQLWKNGPYWAECNVGASQPEECGYRFWWGDAVGCKHNASNSRWISVKDGTEFEFRSGNCPTYGKENAQLRSMGYIDATGNLVATHDAATAHLGAPWRMPTDAEFSALISNCTTTWTTRNGVAGLLVTGKGAYATKSIFLPAAGFVGGSNLFNLGSDGYYWSSTPIPSGDAWHLYLVSSGFCLYRIRCDYGLSVRPVQGFADSSVMVGVVTTHLAMDCTKADQIEVTSVTAQPRYPWNGLVDIAVTIQGAAEKMSDAECTFAATNSAIQASIPIEHITRNGDDVESVDGWVRKFIWDAKADVGAVKIDDVALTVDVEVLPYVQLWENGPCWARCNVGATKPEEYGYYFWWGDTVGYKRNANNNGWVSVKDETVFSFGSGNCPTYGKDSSQLQSEGYVDSTGNLVAAHDAATTHLGAPWRMPTDAEFSALINNCDTEWTSRNGVFGRLVKGRGAYASKSIFLPAVGYGLDSRLFLLGSDGHYWSSTSYSDYSNGAWYLIFDSSNFYWLGSSCRYEGRSVRPVRGFANASGGVVSFDSAVTTHFALDTRSGMRLVSAGSTLAVNYSPDFSTVQGVATVRVLTNGAVWVESSVAGTKDFTFGDAGIYQFAHQVLANGVVADEMSAWYAVAEMGRVDIPDTWGKIPAGLFRNCDWLKSVTIPNSVTNIAATAFVGCDNVTNVALHGGVLKGRQIIAPELVVGTEWIEESETLDGDKVYRSNVINHNQSTAIEFEIPEGMEQLVFSWKVGSENNFDWLTWHLDYVQKDRISGSRDWVSLTNELDGAAHRLKFVYSKDGSASTSPDCGWVSVHSSGKESQLMLKDVFPDSPITTVTVGDEVRDLPDEFFADCGELTRVIFEGETPPNASDDVFAGTPPDLKVCIRMPLSGWLETLLEGEWHGRKVAVLIPPDYDVTQLPRLQKQGFFFMGWTWANGNPVTDGRVRTADEEVIPHRVSICEWLDLNEDVAAVTGGDMPWVGEIDESVRIVASGKIGNSQESWIEVAIPGPARVSFDWHVSCEESMLDDKDEEIFFDGLEFLVDGETVGTIEGEVDWTTVELDIMGAEPHVLWWRYFKDEQDSKGEDGGAIANLVITPYATVTFAASGDATGDPPADMTCLVGASVKLPSAGSLVWAKHRFVGWSDGEAVCQPGDEYEITKLKTVFTAVWEEKHLAAPTITVPEMFAADTVEVVISAESGASVHYTLDGSVPTGASPLYRGPFSVADDCTIRAIALRDDWYDSSIATVTTRKAAYAVRFDAGSCGVITSGDAVQTVKYGGAAVAPTVMPDTWHAFDGWDKPFDRVTSNLTVTANYRLAVRAVSEISCYVEKGVTSSETGIGVYLDEASKDGCVIRMTEDNAWCAIAVEGYCRVSCAIIPEDVVCSVDGEEREIAVKSGRMVVEVTGEGSHEVRWTGRAQLSDFEVVSAALLSFAAAGGEAGDVPAPIPMYVGDEVTLPGPGSLVLAKHAFMGWRNGEAVLRPGSVYAGSLVAKTMAAVWEEKRLAVPVVDAPEYFEAEGIQVVLDAEDGAEIRYTLDGTEPSASSALYEGPFAVGETVTIRAIAFRDDWFDSAIAEQRIVRGPWTFGEYLEMPGQTFSISGDAGWVRAKGEGEEGEGSYVLRSGTIGDSQESVLSMKVQGAGTVSFKYRVSSQAKKGIISDGLAVRLDSSEEKVFKDGGDTGWKMAEVSVVGTGEHTVAWVYWKNGSGSDGEDCAWLDRVEWTPFGPSVSNDPDATVTGNAETGFVVRPSEGNTTVEVTIPQGVDAAKVTVEVSTKVASVKANGAKVRVVSGGADITEFLNVPAADGSGVVDLTKATVKEEIVKEAMDVEKGAEIVLDAANPSLTTPNTRKGLFYQLREGATLDGMKDGDSTVGDGQPWSPEITVKGGNAAFYSIGVGKGE